MNANAEARWVEVGRIADLPEGVTGLTIDDQQIALCRIGDDFYALDNVCSHEYALLSEGWLDDDCTLECPLHAACFDVRTGKALKEPATVDLRTYPLRQEDGVLYLDLGPA